MTADFGFLTLRQPQDTLTANKVNGANEGIQKSGQDGAKATGVDLKNTDIFTAKKNGVQAQAAQKNLLAGGNSGFAGKNLFGDEAGFGDTVSFTTNPNTNANTNVDTNNTSNQRATAAGGHGIQPTTAAGGAKNDGKLQNIAKELGCEANEKAVKSKLNSLNGQDISKLSSTTINDAKDLKLVSQDELDKKAGINNNGQDKENAGAGYAKQVEGIKFANNDSEIAELAEKLGCEADEDAVKTALTSMDISTLAKQDSDVLDAAENLGFIAKSDIDKKSGANQNNDNNEPKDQSQSIKFGAFTFDSEV